MAVLRMYAASEPYGTARNGDLDDRRTGVLATLRHLLSSDLPEDVREAEVTVLAFFRASQVLNFLTGGKPEMTFSARAWRSRRTARSVLSRCGWMLTTAIVDTSCAVLRGERDHCEIAWVNYVRRPNR